MWLRQKLKLKPIQRRVKVSHVVVWCLEVRSRKTEAQVQPESLGKRGGFGACGEVCGKNGNQMKVAQKACSAGSSRSLGQGE